MEKAKETAEAPKDHMVDGGPRLVNKGEDVRLRPLGIGKRIVLST